MKTLQKINKEKRKIFLFFKTRRSSEKKKKRNKPGNENSIQHPSSERARKIKKKKNEKKNEKEREEVRGARAAPCITLFIL